MVDRRVALLAALVALPAAADETPALDAERDELVAKIARGVEYEASVRRLRALIAERDQRVATSQQARDAERARTEAQRAWQDGYRKTGDHEVGWRCTLSPDPAHPLPSTESRFRPDWGKVVRKARVRLAPKNELDEGEPATLYEVAGVARTYQLRGDRFDPFRQPLAAEVGDLVLVCHGGEDTVRGLPAGWGPRLVTGGFALPIARPPLIVDKARWQPIHVTDSVFFWAIHDVRWKWPDGHVLSDLTIGRALPPAGDVARFDMPTSNGLSWVLEVPRGLRNREHLVPGRNAWIILGNHRFDRALKKLVLVAEDVEPTYIKEVAPRD